jgi:hypothetical protein
MRPDSCCHAPAEVAVMKTRNDGTKAIVAVLSCTVLMLWSCAQEDESIQAPVATTDSWVSDITTMRPVDIGVIHNVVLARMNARAAAPGGMNYEEYVFQIRKAVNLALEPYEPSREITTRDCEMAVGLAVTEVDPYFDLSLEDSTRMDPDALLHHWLERGFISEVEFAQLRLMFAGKGAESVSVLDPISEPVALASSVYSASVHFWTTPTKGAIADEEPPTKGVRNMLADGFGGLIGGILGGPIGGGLTGMITSTLFMMDRPGGWCIACGPNSGPGENPPMPCGGYQGAGPCDD